MCSSDLSKASWLGIFEIVTEVLAAGILSLIAGAIALLTGHIIIGIIVLCTTIPVIGLWAGLFFLTAKKDFQVPKIFVNLVLRLRKEKGQYYLDKTNVWMTDICTMTRQNIHAPHAKKAFLISFLISLASWLVFGISFMFISFGTEYTVSAIDSILAVMAGNAIGNMPVTVGGSGLAEFGTWAYL